MNKGVGVKSLLLLIMVLLLALGSTGIAHAVTVQTLPQTKLSLYAGWAVITQAGFEEGVRENVTISSWAADLSSCLYRKPVIITNNGGAELTNYQVKVDVSYDSHMQGDFDDIRFTDSDGNLLSHWRESYAASTSAVFWVKVPSIPGGYSTIYMYYGNAGASSASDGEATFVFFDDFESGNLDKWTLVTDTFWTIATDQKRSGTYSLKAGATSSSNKYIVATGVDEADLVYDSWWYATATTPDICSQFRASNTTPYNDYHINWEGQWTIAKLVGGSWTSINPVSGTLPQNTWFKTTIIIKGSPGQTKFLLDDVQINPASGWLDVGTDHTSGTVGHRAWTANNDWWIDDVRARKYADPEPTTTIGAEEELSLCKVELVVKSDWYSTAWTRRLPVTINNAGSALTDYQIKITVSYDSDMQADFADIRFTDSDGQTLLSHWRESYTANTSAVFWVNVTSIPTGNSTIYMYYGNPSANSASDGDATFVFFDDFDDGSLGTAWTFSQIGGAVGSYTESGTVIRLTGTNTGDLWDTSDKFLFLSISGNYDNVLVESYTSAWGGAHGTWSKMGGVQLRQSLGANSKNRIMSPVYSARGATNSYRLATGGSTFEQTTPTTMRPDYNRVSRVGGTSRAWYSTDGNTWTELGSQISFAGGLTNPVYLGIHLAGLSTSEHWVEVDWFRVRQYASPEPSSSAGAEEGFYVPSGTIASKVYDTGKAEASWDWLGWNETVETGVTDITFEVRASDTAFAKDNATLPWQPASALPITGRYQQWRATLTTSDTSKTPVLHEVRVLYS